MLMSDCDAHRVQTAGLSQVSFSIRNAKLALPTEGPLMSRQDLLSTVEAVKSLLADTYIQLNARAPPNKLPLELLVMVFRQALPIPDTAISFPAVQSDGYGPVLHALKVISQVCHLWRDIVLRTPALWTRIDARACPTNELCSLVQRSHPLLLSIVLDNVREGGVRKDFELLRTNSSRLHRLDLDVQIPAPSVVEELLSFDGSTLHCLTMSSSILEGQPNLDSDHLKHTVSILEGQTHSLEALAVVPSLGWIPANHFPSLTHLYISFDISNDPPDPQNILFLLRNTPRLEIAHFHDLGALVNPPINEPSRHLHVELLFLRSLVFTASAYHPVVHILRCLSLEPSVLVRLDDLFVPHNSQNPGPIPADLRPLSDVSTMEIAIEDEILFLLVEGTSSGFWLKVRHTVDGLWDGWVSGLPTMLPLGNIVSLRVGMYSLILPSILHEMVQLVELSVRLTRDQFWMVNGEPVYLPPPVTSLCIWLSQSQPVECPALRSLTIEWSRDQLKDLSVTHIIDMLTTRSRLGHPIRRLVVQAIPVQFGSVWRTHFSEQLAALAAYVDEYEERVNPVPRLCAFEMREMWNVEGAEQYWVVDEKQMPRHPEMWGYDYIGSYHY